MGSGVSCARGEAVAVSVPAAQVRAEGGQQGGKRGKGTGTESFWLTECLFLAPRLHVCTLCIRRVWGRMGKRKPWVGGRCPCLAQCLA